MKNITCGIYVIKNMINEKIYIGSSINIKNRWVDHKKLLRSNKHHSSYLQNSWNKYGESKFDFIVIEECTSKELIKREQFHLDSKLKANDLSSNYFKINGYNLCRIAGNTLGKHFNEKSKNKMSLIKQKNGKLLNFDFTDIEIKYNIIEKNVIKDIDINNPFYNKKHSEETRRVMSEKKKKENNPNYGKKSPMLGKKHSEETRRVMSEKNKGKNNKNSKKVFQYDINGKLIKTWDSVGSVCKLLNLSVGNISSCCLNKRKTAYGFIWSYILFKEN